MKQLDEDWQAQTGIKDPRRYSIFYSQVHPFPIMVLGHNPGGNPSGTLYKASQYYDNWEHEYVEFRNEKNYPIARVMFTLLRDCLGLGPDAVKAIRKVPKTNVIFRRSPDSSGVGLRDAEQAAPFVRRILKEVNPRVILFEGRSTWNVFKKLHIKGEAKFDTKKVITCPNGQTKVVLYDTASPYVPCLVGAVRAIVLGHPSKFGTRPQWRTVTEQVRQDFKDLELCPLPQDSSAMP